MSFKPEQHETNIQEFGTRAPKAVPLEVSVLHGFSCPNACTALAVSPDGDSLVYAGTYKPCMGVFTLSEHTQKFERNMDSEATRVSVLDETWKKLAFLQISGKIEFHTQFGKHCAIDTPAECRDMQLDKVRGEVLATSKRSDIFRFSTSEGKYLPTVTSQVEEIEAVAVSPVHSIYAVCGAGGVIELIDSRSPSTAKKTAKVPSVSATSCAFAPDGIHLGVGTHEGISYAFDIRSPVYISKKDHGYDQPIKKIRMGKKTVVSMDRSSVKVWDVQSTRTLSAVEPGFALNDFAVHNGILFLGGDSSEMKTYFLPPLGIIPRWCSYLEGSADDLLETKKSTFFTQYRFVTLENLRDLGLEKEIGTAARPHMHGYLVHAEYLEKRRKKRISGDRKLM